MIINKNNKRTMMEISKMEISKSSLEAAKLQLWVLMGKEVVDLFENAFENHNLADQLCQCLNFSSHFKEAGMSVESKEQLKNVLRGMIFAKGSIKND